MLYVASNVCDVGHVCRHYVAISTVYDVRLLFRKSVVRNVCDVEHVCREFVAGIVCDVCLGLG